MPSGSSNAAAKKIEANIGVEMRLVFARQTTAPADGDSAIEFVRREVRLGSDFDRTTFDEALSQFRTQYSKMPDRGVCAPDVFARAAHLFAGSTAAAHQYSTRLQFAGIPIIVGIVAPGTIVFEGSVDETKMGDW